MGQEFHILRCFSCSTFQTHIVKKIKKWQCKMCGEKQSLKKVYGQGTGKDCRLHTQKLNTLRLKKEEMPLESCDFETDECPQLDHSVLENQNGGAGVYADGLLLNQYGDTNVRRIEGSEFNEQKKIKLDSESFIDNNCASELAGTLGNSASTRNKSNKPGSSKWDKYFEETKPDCCTQDEEISDSDNTCSKYLEGTSDNCYRKNRDEKALLSCNSKWGKYLEETETTCLRQYEGGNTRPNCNEWEQNEHTSISDRIQDIYKVQPNIDTKQIKDIHKVQPNIETKKIKDIHKVQSNIDTKQIKDIHKIQPIIDTKQIKDIHKIQPIIDTKQIKDIHKVQSNIDTKQIKDIHKIQSIFEQCNDDVNFDFDF